ncbi:MAG: S8 family serine peptidase [Ruegeria sp.]|uniref:S8 family peptidase n=1 Tax=Ruegeria sp. TaxID=1879320 RepID=UPI00349EAEA6
MSDFIILRNKNVGRTFEEGLGPRNLAASDAPEPELSVESLEGTDIRDAQADPEVVEMARSMPTRLIEPTEGEAPAGAEPTWGVTAVGADTAAEDGSGVRVCVLDTGIDAGHAAFAGVNLIERDFTGSGNGDVQGHGTHCAGTVFGRDVDGTRIGVAPGVTDALIGKVLGNDGSGQSDWLFQAMNWASDNNAKVISMSLGFDFPGLVERLVEQDVPELLAASIALEAYRMNLRVFDRIMDLMAARAAFNGGAVVCAATGNESLRDVSPDLEVSASLPAAARGIVSVGAASPNTGAGFGIADFSNTNPTVSAPGVNVLSANVGGGLRALNGTSMATPHVAGLAALWWQRAANSGFPATSEAVKARLRTASDPSVFAPGIEIPLRGDGMAQAPKQP